MPGPIEPNAEANTIADGGWSISSIPGILYEIPPLLCKFLHIYSRYLAGILMHLVVSISFAASPEP